VVLIEKSSFSFASSSGCLGFLCCARCILFCVLLAQRFSSVALVPHPACLLLSRCASQLKTFLLSLVCCWVFVFVFLLFFPCSSLRFPRLVFRSASNAPDGSCFCSFDFFGRVWRALLVSISVSPALGFGLVTGFGGEEHPTRSFVLLCHQDGSGRCCSDKGFVFFFRSSVRFSVLSCFSRFVGAGRVVPAAAMCDLVVCIPGLDFVAGYCSWSCS
jgi:hypothetical protein